jgi:hypothetical protein
MKNEQAIKKEIKKQAYNGRDIEYIKQAVKVQFPSSTWTAELAEYAMMTVVEYARIIGITATTNHQRKMSQYAYGVLFKDYMNSRKD